MGDPFSAAARGNASSELSRVKTALLRLSCQSAAAFGSPRSRTPGRVGGSTASSGGRRRRRVGDRRSARPLVGCCLV
jgi:hypothetical protein